MLLIGFEVVKRRFGVLGLMSTSESSGPKEMDAHLVGSDRGKPAEDYEVLGGGARL